MSKTIYAKRLTLLRERLREKGMTGFVIPLTDERLSEYVGDYAKRLEWLTGFNGSAGSAVVLPEKAAIFVDGRYTLQVREQVDGNLWEYQSLLRASIIEWIGANAPADARIGYDPWLHTQTWCEAAAKSLADKGVELLPLRANPVDAVWSDRPAPSSAKLVVHPQELAGKDAAEKRQEIANWLHEMKADAVVLSALDSIAWTFNIRGKDVSRTPVALAYAVVHRDATADFYVAPEKIPDDAAQHLSNAVRVRDRAAFAGDLAELKDKTVVVDPERAVAAIFAGLAAAGAKTVALREPTVLYKAIKNAAEIAGQRAAQVRDGVALSKFLHWLSIEAPHGGLTEIAAADKLEALRRETGLLVDLSFDTISGAGTNGAIVHYKVDETTNRPIEMNSLYLVDSGGQYSDGTTDVTRTLAIGTPTTEMKDRFTRVLKGHIALATAVFPAGTRGGQIDMLARQYLWAAGLDYPHGTGHGVGSFLAVHEGPQRIAKPRGDSDDEPLRAGMIVSNEPGYYKAGEYGIRIENLMLVEQRSIEGAESLMLGFEMLSFAPIERRLIAVAMLSADERAWLDAYHAMVLAVVGPPLQREERLWLEKQCAVLS